MTSLLTPQNIAGSLFAYWRDQLPLGVTTVYGGAPEDTAPLDEWIELWVDAWQRRPQRAGALRLVDLSVTAHCFVKPATDRARVQELAQAAAQTLSQTTVPIYDTQSSGLTLIGHAQVFEEEIRVLTRNESSRHALQHLVVTWSGIAQLDQ